MNLNQPVLTGYWISDHLKACLHSGFNRPMRMTPKLWMCLGFFLLDMAFWISYWAFGCVHLTETEWPINNIVTTHKGRGTQIRSLEVSDVASLWSCGTNCMWRAGSNSCYLDVLHCLTVYSNQGTNRSLAFINCQPQKGKTQGSVLKMSAVIAVRPLFALGKGGVRWCQGRLCQSFVVFGLVFVTLQIIVLFL